jgi:uncharacterized RDD family membrane protein YckC
MPFCPDCGSPVDETSNFCPKCGRAIAPLSLGESSGSVPGAATATVPRQAAQMIPTYASIGDRFVAQIVDWLILIVIDAIVSIPVGLASILSNPLGLAFSSSAYSAYSAIAGLLIPLLYFSYFEYSSGKTIGKRVMSIRVVDALSGGSIDFGRALIRTVLRIVDFLPFFYIVGVIVIDTSSKKQRLGDVGANTIVIKEK